MRNQDFEVLSSALLRNLAKKWWVVLIFAVVGAGFSLKSRKDLPQEQRIQATILSSIDREIFQFLIDEAPDLNIKITYNGNTTMKVAVDAESEPESKFMSWIKISNQKIAAMLGDSENIQLLKLKEKSLTLQKDANCRSPITGHRDSFKNCLLLDGELLHVQQEVLRTQPPVMKVISVKPFILQPSSLPKRDLLFGFFIGAVIGLILTSAVVQFRLAKKKT